MVIELYVTRKYEDLFIEETRKLVFDSADEQHKYDRFSDDRFTLEILSHSFHI